jgi:regulator of nucleoside diphosphate kinase
MSIRNIVISSTDYDRLQVLVNSSRFRSRGENENLDSLERELRRATIVPEYEVPADVITLNATVWFIDLDTQEVECYTLVFPNEADVNQHRISVLAPIGTALLGYRVRDIIEWTVPAGTRRLKIIRVVHQHEFAVAAA